MPLEDIGEPGQIVDQLVDQLAGPSARQLYQTREPAAITPRGSWSDAVCAWRRAVKSLDGADRALAAAPHRPESAAPFCWAMLRTSIVLRVAKA
jgi:hypothetical protein